VSPLVFQNFGKYQKFLMNSSLHHLLLIQQEADNRFLKLLCVIIIHRNSIYRYFITKISERSPNEKVVPEHSLFRIVRDRSGSFRIVRDRSGSFRIVRDRSGSFRIVRDRSGSFRIVRDRSGSFRIVQDRSGSFRIVLNRS
jgi:uncharacterized protein YegP (UPF0339 family)